MKILKIEFQNINSLKGNHEVDFTKSPFTAGSLFAITGPTGSGKSTILDVISLALFNRVPRLDKVSKNEILKTGSILTRNQKEAMAAVTYESKNGRYRSQWTISTAKTGNLREYEMELNNAETGTIIDLKKSEVPAKNEQLIGLNYNQFIKSVLLAQGEFAQFLKAKKDERGELLEKITGTGIYRLLGQKSFEKHKEVSREIQQQQSRIEAIREQLLEEEKRTVYAGQFKEKESACEPLKKELEKLSKSLELKALIGAQKKEINLLEEQKVSATKRLEQFDKEHGLPLKQHEKVQDYAEELRSWSRLKNEILELENELKTSTENERKNRKNKENCLAETREFTGAEVSEKNLEQVLHSFTREILEIQEAKKEKQNHYKHLKDRFQLEMREVDFQLNGESSEGNLHKLERLHQNSEIKIKELKRRLNGTDLNNPERERSRLQRDLQRAMEACQKADKIGSISADIQKLREEKAEISPKMEAFPKEIEKARTKIEALKNRLEMLNLKKQNQLLQASLAEHRAQLKDGEACPLCGSTDHPFAKDLPEKDDSLEIAIRKTDKNLAEWNHELSTVTAGLKHYRDRLAEVEARQKDLEDSLKKQEISFSEKFKHLEKSENTSWDELCDNYQGQIDLLAKFEKEQRKFSAISAGIPLMKDLGEVLTAGKALKEKLEGLYSGSDIQTDSQALQNRWIRLQQEQKNIAFRQEELGAKTKVKTSEKEKLEQQLLPAIREKGFADVAQAREALIPEVECHALRMKREEFQKQINKAKASLELLSSQLADSKKRDVEENKEELEQSLKIQKLKLEQIGAECRELDRILKNHAENLKRLENIRAEIAEKEKQIRRWKLLDELIGDSKGKKFNDFAQDLSLNQLLQLANIRLRDLSDRYRLDKPTEDEYDGLVAIDEHMGGQRRSVKTLSGGETFILSLSMALALSDLASKNVKINSLFIDEGFGTLDPETLDQTLDTLEKLQAESSKTIGIISHVESLKERIATQIQLKRNGQGYSSLEIRS